MKDAGLTAALVNKINATSQLVDASIQAVQKVATELRPATLDKLGLAPALEQAAREFSERTHIRCEFDPMPPHFDLAPERATGVFRIFQETLTNIARHARATVVQTRLTCDRGNLLLEVRDNGRGIAKPQLTGKKSLGLLGMYERAYLLSGRLDIHGRDSRGTTVKLTLPCQPPP